VKEMGFDMEQFFNIEDQDQDLEIYSISDDVIEELLGKSRESIKSVPAGDDAFVSVESSVLIDILTELEKYRLAEHNLQTHLSHCNIWPYDHSCKYGEPDCPALLIKIDPEQLAQALFSVQGGVNAVDGTWNSDIVQRVYTTMAEGILDILVKSDD